MRIAALVLITEGKYYLSISLKGDISTEFNLPGSYIKSDEAYEHAAIRELEDITGVHVEENDLRIIYENSSAKTFYATKWSGKAHISDNYIVEWLPLCYLKLSHTSCKYNTEVLNKYIKYIS